MCRCNALATLACWEIVAEAGIASGVRRIEAVTGGKCLVYVQELESTAAKAAGALKVTVPELSERIQTVLNDRRRWKKKSAHSKANWHRTKAMGLSQSGWMSRLQSNPLAKWKACRRRRSTNAARHRGEPKQQTQIRRGGAGQQRCRQSANCGGCHSRRDGQSQAGELVNFRRTSWRQRRRQPGHRHGRW